MASKTLILAVETSSRNGSVAIALGQKLLAQTTFPAPLKHSAEIFPATKVLLSQFGRKPDEIEHIYISSGPGSFTGLRIAVTLAKTMHLANAAKIVAVDSLDVIAANVIDLAGQNPAPRHACPGVAKGEDGSDERRETSNDINPTPSSDERRETSDEFVASILDAKRGQFFIAVYQCTGHACPGVAKGEDGSDERRTTSDGIWNKIVPDSIISADEFLDKFACKERPIRLLGDGLVYHKDKFEAEGVGFFDENLWSPRADKVHLLGWQKAQAGQFADPMSLTPNYLLRPDIKIKRR